MRENQGIARKPTFLALPVFLGYDEPVNNSCASQATGVCADAE